MYLLNTREFEKLSEKDCISVQLSLQNNIIQEDRLKYEDIQLIAGVDLAYWQDGKTEKAVCSIVSIDFKTHEVVESKHTYGNVTFQYIPGCLAFRELPLILETVNKLETKPDIYIFDGNGILHPRKTGLATHASFYLNTPTIGIAKTYYKLEEAEHYEVGDKVGNYSNIVKNGETLGRILRTHSGVKPIVVSVGNYISLDTSTRIALSLVEKHSRIPIPTRYADIETHRLRKELKGGV